LCPWAAYGRRLAAVIELPTRVRWIAPLCEPDEERMVQAGPARSGAAPRTLGEAVRASRAGVREAPGAAERQAPRKDPA